MGSWRAAPDKGLRPLNGVVRNPQRPRDGERGWVDAALIGSEPMVRPVIVLNPRSDVAFVAFAEECVKAGADRPMALQEQLRERYPRAVVRERNLHGEAPTWYVYREGAWIPSEG